MVDSHNVVGSVWGKWDLHAHTPLDPAWDNKPNLSTEAQKKKFAQEYVSFAKTKDLRLVAITDHNFCNELSELVLPYIQEIASSEGLTILPGFEISASDGSGIHLLVIFSEDTNLSAIKSIVDQCFPPTTSLIPTNGIIPVSNKTIDEIKGIVAASGLESVFIFAHSDRENGVLDPSTITGARRVQEWKKEFIHIAQISKPQKEYPDENFMHKVIYKKDPNYSREMTYILASDCRSISETGTREERLCLGEKFSYVKAEPTFEGLKQIIYELDERVCLEDVLPDDKENHQVIDRIEIEDSDNFPSVVLFNQNLSSIIGSKSSGKSLILSYLGYSIDQIDVIAKNEKINLDGPAAGYGWDTVPPIKVFWRNGDVSEPGELGNKKIIYIPQGYLTLGIDSDETITDLIKPTLFEAHPDVEKASEKLNRDIIELSQKVDNEIDNMFSHKFRVDSMNKSVKNLGDEKALKQASDGLEDQIKALKKEANLSEDNLKKYDEIQEDLNKRAKELDDLGNDVDELEQYISEFEVSVSPLPQIFFSKFRDDMNSKIISSKKVFEGDVKKTVSAVIKTLKGSKKKLKGEFAKIETVNKKLFLKVEKSEKVKALFGRKKKIDEGLLKLNEYKGEGKKHQSLIGESMDRLVGFIKMRHDLMVEHVESINYEVDNDLTIGAELKIDSARVKEIAKKLNFHNSTEWDEKIEYWVTKEDGKEFDYNAFIENSKKLLVALLEGKLKISSDSVGIVTTFKIVCQSTEYTSLIAEFEGDRIGGSHPFSMTPGKRALVYLKLILGNKREKWPLLIDQPEDDLDSRSISDVIVPFIKSKKRERQIIMVSHNANLVVGADSEQVIVANRHAADRPNSDRRAFNYLSGGLEVTRLLDDTEADTLKRQGIREHVCDILEGGEEAFKKRGGKLNIM